MNHGFVTLPDHMPREICENPQSVFGNVDLHEAY